MAYRITLLITSLILLFGCSKDEHDARLTHISKIVSESPKDALYSLDSINYLSLSKQDKYFYDFLSIKAKDKAYITHTSDSTFIRIFNYYSNRKADNLYPEVLYYGGRVYCDLGDSPTALRYFQMALEQIPNKTEYYKLKCQILSQTGRLLNSLRLYNNAIPYIKKAVELDIILNDSINEVYDLQLLGGVYLRSHEYEQAENYFSAALTKSQNLPLTHQAKSTMYLAAVKLKKGQIPSALQLIRKTPMLVNPKAKNSALAYAIEIYQAAGILDTAYNYAQVLIHSNDYTNKKTGYQTILSPEFRHLVNPDSIDRYISDYRTILENHFNENEIRLVLTQQSLYNYQLHEREKAKTEKANNVLKEWIYGFIMLITFMALYLSYLKNKNKTHIIELQQALEIIDKLKHELNSIQKSQHSPEKGSINYVKQSDTNNTQPSTLISKPTEENLRECLKNELLSLYEYSNNKTTISNTILQSEIYEKLQKMIADSKSIKENDEIWSKLEKVVLESSPKFISNLNLLTSGKLTHLDLHTALLIKCGFKPSQMTVLLGKSNGAIISRRETLCIKVLGEKLSVKVIDGIIRLL